MVLGCLCRIFRFGAHFPGFSQDFPVLHMIFEVWRQDLGNEVWVLGMRFRVWENGVLGIRFRVWVLGMRFRVWKMRFWVSGLGFGFWA